MFQDEFKMLIALDDFIFKAKGLCGLELRDKLISKIYDFLRENELDGDQQNFVDLRKFRNKNKIINYEMQ